MLSHKDFDDIYLYRQFTDMRKSINGLVTLVETEMALDPYKEALFVFCNKRRNRLKVLYWDRTGFALWFKRLEEGKFKWPKFGASTIEMNSDELGFILEGFDINAAKPLPTVSYERSAV